MTGATDRYAILTDVTPSRATVVRVGTGEPPTVSRDLVVATVTCEMPQAGERVWIRRDSMGPIVAARGPEHRTDIE